MRKEKKQNVHRSGLHMNSVKRTLWSHCIHHRIILIGVFNILIIVNHVAVIDE